MAIGPEVTGLQMGALYSIQEATSGRILHVQAPEDIGTPHGHAAVLLVPLNKAFSSHLTFRQGPARVDWVLEQVKGRVVGFCADPITQLKAERDRLLEDVRQLREEATIVKYGNGSS